MLFIRARNHGGSPNEPIRRIVMHGTVSACRAGQALVVARMFATTTRDASTQYVHDPSMSVQCVPENVVAYGAPPNTGALHHELCDPQPQHPTAAQRARWADADHQAMLRRAAVVVAMDCTRHKLPVRKLSAADLRRGALGITDHASVSAAWHQTDHVDPGPDFPWTQFLGMVKAAQKSPAQTPDGDDMPTPLAAVCHKVQPIGAAPGIPKVLQIRDDGSSESLVSVLLGPCRVEGTVSVWLDKVPAGRVTLNAYLATKDANGDWQVGDSTAGWAEWDASHMMQLHISKSVPAGALLRLRAIAAEPLNVTYVRHDLSTWKA